MAARRDGLPTVVRIGARLQMRLRLRLRLRLQLQLQLQLQLRFRRRQASSLVMDTPIFRKGDLEWT